MAELQDIIAQRTKKRNELKRLGVNPYPSSARRSMSIASARARFAQYKKKRTRISLAGRVLLMRPYGAITFFKISDGTGEIQVLVRAKSLPEAEWKALKLVDVGDFISARGGLITSKTGEKTLEAVRVALAVKALRPLPDKWHGLSDVEERFRRRYLDLLMNKAVRERFVARAAIVAALRRELSRDGFLEVETPILQAIPAGAAARPFKTHLAALDIPLYLRIAPELFLKELLVGGFEKVFELGRSFRNEGMDATHNPEFTSIEGYWAYQDARSLMAYLEKLVGKTVVKAGLGTFTMFRGNKIRWKTPFARKTFASLVKEYAHIDVSRATQQEMAQTLLKGGFELPHTKTDMDFLDAIFKKFCLPRLIQPTFVSEHPLALSPLAKAKDDESLADRFQLIAGGMELINAYSELNDPEEQRARFEKSEAAVAAGSHEAQRGDEAFVEALEYGMPPAAGFGIGIDRLVMLLCDASNIREVILFPTMRSKKAGE